MAIAPHSLVLSPIPVEAPDVADIDHLEQDEKSISTSISKTWTDQAIKCHLTNADCANCSVARHSYSFKCQMDKVVPILLNALGEPDADRVEKLRLYLYD